jgi:hypothetical protein
MSLRKAINLKCRECIYDPMAEGTWRQQISDCTSPNCPLYPYRPTCQGYTPNRADSVDFGGKLDGLQVLEVGR